MGKKSKFKMMDDKSCIPFAYDYNCKNKCEDKYSLLGTRPQNISFNSIAKSFNKLVNYTEPKYSKFDLATLDS